MHQSLPIYSSGLGGLAGDLLKEASDRALPPVAVGLMYRRGHFRQRLEVSGWQQEYWIDIDPQRLPTALGVEQDDQALTDLGGLVAEALSLFGSGSIWSAATCSTSSTTSTIRPTAVPEASTIRILVA